MTTPGGRARIGREYYHVCDVGLEGKKLFQPKMSSLLTPGNMKQETQEDTIKNFIFTTHSVGQNSSEAQTDCIAGIIASEDRTVGIESGARKQTRR